MLYRVKGVATAWRYGNTELYSSGNKKPDNMEWSEYINVILDSYDHDAKNSVKKSLNQYMKLHKNRTSMAIPKDDPHPISGVSWKWLCKVAVRGDMKGRQSNTLNNQSVMQREKLGITLEEAKRKYC
jgi:predicted phosphoadenosine phosphosulfate sulfurtransferase